MSKIFVRCLFLVTVSYGQYDEHQTRESDSIPNLKKIDGIASVVGDYVILESEVGRAFTEMKNQGLKAKDMTRCQLIGKLMEDKLYAHHAIQDSIHVLDENVKQSVDNQIDYFLKQMNNDMSKLLAFYKKDSEKELRDELSQINKQLILSQQMQQKITENIEVTPEEVRKFFKKITDKDELYFGTELEISQIVITPKIPKEETQRIVNRLNQIKEDIEEQGASFASKALLYSQDPGSRPKGGLYTITKKSPMVKEFKDVAFSLQEGELSDPFETEFGWHLMKLDKIKGKTYDVRHILLIPEPSFSAIREAKEKIMKLRQRIIDKEISFKDAAGRFSDEKETKFNDGKLINPKTLDTKFELAKLDPRMYSQIEKLRDDEISAPILEEGRNGKKTYKIIKIANRIDAHKADYARDYNKIHDLALADKKIRLIGEWIDEKIQNTYVYVGEGYRKNCKFSKNWLKK